MVADSTPPHRISGLTSTLIRFAPPGFFVMDGRVSFSVNGALVGDGSFLAGVDVRIGLPPGTHVLDATLSTGFIRRHKQWTVTVPEIAPGDESIYEVRVGYSRTWGTFAKDLATRTVSESALQPSASEPAPEAARGPGKATLLLLAVLAACFALELAFPVAPGDGPSPAIETLVGFGGADVPHTMAGQWFRLVSCTFLHGNLLHLVFNALAIFFGGSLVERAVGPRWFVVLYLLGGIAGSVVSLRMNAGNLVSVGASGGALALFSAGLFAAQTLPRPSRGPTQFHLIRVLVLSLVPTALPGGMQVDIGAHIGGALAGAVIGAIYFVAIRRGSEGDDRRGERFRRSKLAWAFLVPLALTMLWTAHGVARVAYPQARSLADLMASLAPDAEIKISATPTSETMTDWTRRYPNDPRVLLLQLEAAQRNEDWRAADELIARGREATQRYRTVFTEDSLAQFRGSFDAVERDVALRRRLLPNRELPKGTDKEYDAAWKVNARGWLARFPEDPRVRSTLAWEVGIADDEAAEHVRIGLKGTDTFAAILPGSAAMREGFLLRKIYLLSKQNRTDEMMALAATLCKGTSESADIARKSRLCSGSSTQPERTSAKRER